MRSFCHFVHDSYFVCYYLSNRIKTVDDHSGMYVTTGVTGATAVINFQNPFNPISTRESRFCLPLARLHLHFPCPLNGATKKTQNVEMTAHESHRSPYCLKAIKSISMKITKADIYYINTPTRWGSSMDWKKLWSNIQIFTSNDLIRFFLIYKLGTYLNVP